MSLLFTIGDGNRTAEQAPLCHGRKTTTGQAFCRVGALCILTCYYLPPEQLSNSTRKSSQVLPSHIILSLLHQDQFLLSPLRSWAPTGITKLHETPNCATQALVIWSDPSLHPCHIHPDISVISISTSLSYPPWYPCHIHPDIPIISILHPSADLMSVGSAAGEVLECSVEPEGRTGSHRVHQVTINEEWGS